MTAGGGVFSGDGQSKVVLSWDQRGGSVRVSAACWVSCFFLLNSKESINSHSPLFYANSLLASERLAWRSWEKEIQTVLASCKSSWIPEISSLILTDASWKASIWIVFSRKSFQPKTIQKEQSVAGPISILWCDRCGSYGKDLAATNTGSFGKLVNSGGLSIRCCKIDSFVRSELQFLIKRAKSLLFLTGFSRILFNTPVHCGSPQGMTSVKCCPLQQKEAWRCYQLARTAVDKSDRPTWNVIDKRFVQSPIKFVVGLFVCMGSWPHGHMNRLKKRSI